MSAIMFSPYHRNLQRKRHKDHEKITHLKGLLVSFKEDELKLTEFDVTITKYAEVTV